MDDQNLRRTFNEMKEDLKRELRMELLALHLGDDYVISEVEAARLLGVSPRTLRRRRQTGELRCGVLAGKPRYSLGQVRRICRDIGSRKLT